MSPGLQKQLVLSPFGLSSRRQFKEPQRLKSLYCKAEIRFTDRTVRMEVGEGLRWEVGNLTPANRSTDSTPKTCPHGTSCHFTRKGRELFFHYLQMSMSGIDTLISIPKIKH